MVFFIRHGRFVVLSVIFTESPFNRLVSLELFFFFRGQTGRVRFQQIVDHFSDYGVSGFCDLVTAVLYYSEDN
jgi:hypothetical protein